MEPGVPLSAERFAAGIEHFNGGRFFEAHEIWEEIWVEEVGEWKRFLQGLIQAAAACHKAEIGVPGGARKLFQSSLRILEDFAPDAYGVDLATFRAGIRERLAGSAARHPAKIRMVKR
ncbi:MAG: DUF309 domain-containing protein [Candidatus Binatia bacterium]